MLHHLLTHASWVLLAALEDEEYLEQKERMHELMRKLPGVIDLFAYDVSNDRELKDFFNQLA
ncbi:hypothetical protein XBLMG947_0446 [Xanthomonas bromi]|uniref:Uncharacterized protein n=1 Tax=Xanthomonas bromi TaxID=56449 RepID=A0A1C3NH49_9XANT|nr:hypothetical protein XBLMG947_0446 [Xanthomonas bromi]